MLEMKPACEKCEAPTPKDGAAEICSFECTFCPPCAGAMDHRCPNCGGELVRRPVRPAEKLGRFPASTKRILKAEGCTPQAARS